MSVTPRRVATLMVHTSPLDQAGTGDAGGMNIYVCEAAKNMAAQGVAVDIFTRRNNADVVESGIAVCHSHGFALRNAARHTVKCWSSYRFN